MKDEIKKACEVMQKGGVILYPTDTVWGIGCDATNEEAVRRVFEIKRRADSKAMLVLVDSPVKVDFYVDEVPEVAWDLIEMTTKPLTIIYDGARNLAHNLIAEDGSVGIRVTNEEFSKQLCFRFRKAIVSTSANISGHPAPSVFSEISDEIKKAVDYVVDYRREETGHPKPSGIIKLGKGGQIKIIRE
ncbi:MAG TPA: threonylcarbamoyl-AMP synthase [Candidatus Phocaeicola excrementigallinarum]|nr:threonylcarbamoyl-AMP synthase [Candidatus Phocaeicola excrementigallinarum]